MRLIKNLYYQYKHGINAFNRVMNRIPQRNYSSSSNVSAEDPNLKYLAYWLFGVSGLVAGMVTVGGITRLTRSGLSMTSWKIQGSLPPMTISEWEAEFDRYKTFPEWQQRKSMTLEEFKFIFFWEYGHRMMGRAIGVAYVAPLLYFSASGMIPRTLYPRLGLLFGLGGSQGLIGWWMVKSGLDIDPKTTTKEIRVSPYRLATHLGMAFTTYVTLVWTGLDLLNTDAKAKAVVDKSVFTKAFIDQAKRLRKLALHSGGLVALTAISGAYVAGNDAGRAFNTFPMMGDHWVPPDLLEMQPLWKNFFENTATVQFDHRVLAIGTLTSILLMYKRARFSGEFWKMLPQRSKVALNSVTAMSVAQVGLGISTLLLYVPIPLAATHQAGSLILLTLVTGLIHSLKFTRFAANALVK